MARGDDAPTGVTFEQLKELIAALGQKPEQALDPVALAKAVADATREPLPENKVHPHISAFTKPKGFIADPHEPLECDTFFNGFPIHKAFETHSWREIELLNQVQPGSYTILRKDLTPMPVEVKGEYSAAGKLTRKEITFPNSREERHYVPSLVVFLYQITNRGTKSLQQVYLEATQKDLEWQMASMAHS